jgi:hypothetical protein
VVKFGISLDRKRKILNPKNSMKKRYNGIQFLWMILAILMVQFVHAQGNDTALYQQLKVAEMKSWVKFPMMIRQKDSCLSETRQFNEFGKVDYIKSDYNCMGWNRVDETIFKYYPNHLPSEIKTLSNDNIISLTRFNYDDNRNVIREERISFEPSDTLVLTYYPELDRKEKMVKEKIISSNPLKQPSYTRMMDYQKGLLSKVEVVNDTGAVLAKYNYVYNDQGQITDETFESFVPQYSYSKDLYDYANNALVRHTNTLENTATEFIYAKNGLAAQTHWYNRFGQLERIYFNHYTYRP